MGHINSIEAAAIGGAILFTASSEATPLRAADLSAPENSIVISTPLPEHTREGKYSINSAVNTPEFQTSDEQPGFILFNTYDQNDLSAQDRLVSDLATQKSWIIAHGVTADLFEQGIVNMPIIEAQTNFNVPVNRLTQDYGDAKAGSLLVPYTDISGESKLAIYKDIDGTGEQSKIDFVLLTPRAGSQETERKALPILYVKNATGEYVASTVFTVPTEANSESFNSPVPTVTGTPVFQAEVATTSLNLRDISNPENIVGQLPRNDRLIVLSNKKVTIPGNNFQLVPVLTSGGDIGYAAENLLSISEPASIESVNAPQSVYVNLVASAEQLSVIEGIGIKSIDITAEQILPDVEARPIVFIQSTDMDYQSEKLRPGTMSFNNVPDYIPVIHDDLSENLPNFVIDGQEVSLDAGQAIQVAFDQVMWRNAKFQDSVPDDTSFETFLREYRDTVSVKIWDKNGQDILVPANAPVVMRIRGMEPAKRPGLVKTNFGSYERSYENGSLIIDMYYSKDTINMDFTKEDDVNSDESLTTELVNSGIASLGVSEYDADFKEVWGIYYFGKYPIVGGPDMTEIYDPNKQVYLNYGMPRFQRDTSNWDFIQNQYQPFQFN